LAIVVQTLQSAFLPILAAILVFAAINVHSHRMLGLLRRTRWILVSLLVIYAFLTPGEALWSLPLPSPTREGLQDGLMQLSRLVCVLAGLSILLTSLSQDRLISGLYIFAYPLRFVGVSSERIAVRLALTLRYAERAMQETAKDWRSSIEHALIPETEHEAIFELPVQMPAWIDVLILIAIGAILLEIWR
jgi:energy-coupling factor transport system permease protein